jgi:uncharacterized protein (TIGR02118 family)
MNLRMAVIQKKEGLTSDDFRKYWREVHGPIARKIIPGLRRYSQNHVVDSSQLGIDYPRGDQQVDGFSQLWFDDPMNCNRIPKNDTLLAEDEARFIGNMKLLILKQNVVIPTSTDRPLIKRMSILKRRPDVDTETFQREWTEVHSELVRKLPGVEGYTQNLVIDRMIERGKSAAYEEIPIDGIVELWFRDIPSLEAAFASSVGQNTMGHAKTFIGEISTFLVEPYHVV